MTKFRRVAYFRRTLGALSTPVENSSFLQSPVELSISTLRIIQERGLCVGLAKFANSAEEIVAFRNEFQWIYVWH